MDTKDSDKVQLEQALKEAILEARLKIENLEELTKPIAPENSIGRISRMEAIGEKSINEASLEAARQQLRDLDNAMARIDDDGFGCCDDCGESIAHARLLLMPGSRYCVECADKNN